jgi:predicted RNA-binding protein Jag
LQVTSQKTKVEKEKENPSGILYIGAAPAENNAVIQVTARKEQERTQVTQGQAIAKLNEKEQEYRTFITSAIKELEAACEALLLDNGNALTVEEINMQWKRMCYVAKTAMGSMRTFLSKAMIGLHGNSGRIWPKS